MSKALDIITKLLVTFTGFREEITDVVSVTKSGIEATHAQTKTVIDRQDDQIRELSRLVAVVADTRALLLLAIRKNTPKKHNPTHIFDKCVSAFVVLVHICIRLYILKLIWDNRNFEYASCIGKLNILHTIAVMFVAIVVSPIVCVVFSFSGICG